MYIVNELGGENGLHICSLSADGVNPSPLLAQPEPGGSFSEHPSALEKSALLADFRCHLAKTLTWDPARFSRDLAAEATWLQLLLSGERVCAWPEPPCATVTMGAAGPAAPWTALAPCCSRSPAANLGRAGGCPAEHSKTGLTGRWHLVRFWGFLLALF